MPETLTLTTPIVPPTRSGYTFVRLVIDLDAQVIQAVVRGTDGVDVQGEWSGATAVALMTALNTANLTTNSLVKRVFTKLTQDGKLPAGTVAGTPV
jgi:hypothetical protein